MRVALILDSFRFVTIVEVYAQSFRTTAMRLNRVGTRMSLAPSMLRHGRAMCYRPRAKIPWTRICNSGLRHELEHKHMRAEVHARIRKAFGTPIMFTSTSNAISALGLFELVRYSDHGCICDTVGPSSKA